MKLCYIDNVATHYRKAIFLLIDQTFECDYLFGESLGDIKQMDTSLLKGNVMKTKTYKWHGWYWQKGVVSKLWKPYDRYILIGETRALSTWTFCLLARFTGKSRRVFFWSHGWYGKETWLERAIKKVQFHLPGGGIFLYGNYARGLMIKEGFNPDKLFTIHNSLDYDNQLTLRQKQQPTAIYRDHFSNDGKNLIFVGRLTPIKKLDMVLEALADCNNRGEKYNMTFIGDGEKKDDLMTLTHQLGLEQQVWFYGACYDENKLSELIYNADLCVAPGNVGLTAMHALVFGTPVITHNNFPYQMPEFESIHEGETGAFFEQDNIVSLSAAISNWFETHKDREIVRNNCYKEIDEQWTPQFQIEVLKKNLA